MIRTDNIGMYTGIDEPIGYPLRNDKIINTPPDIFLPRASAITPPTVCAFLVRMQITVSIDETGLKKTTETSTFAVGEPGIVAVCLGIGQVNLIMGYIHVTTYHNRFSGIKRFDEKQKFIFPVHTIIEPCKLTLRIRSVDIDKIKTIIFEHHYPTLMVVTLDSDLVLLSERLKPGERRSTRVSFFLRIAIIRCVAVKIEIKLTFLQFYLLKTENISGHRFKNVGKAFPYDSPEAINIPRY